MWLFQTGDPCIEVNTSAGLTVFPFLFLLYSKVGEIYVTGCYLLFPFHFGPFQSGLKWTEMERK